MKLVPLALAMLLAGSLSALAHDVPADIAKSPPAGAFKAVSGLVKLPDFLPGMGQLFVDPATFRPARSSPMTTMARWSARSTCCRSRISIPTIGSTISRRRRAMSITSTSTTMPAIRASKSRMSMSCSGTSRKPTKRRSRNDPDAQAHHGGRRGSPRRLHRRTGDARQTAASSTSPCGARPMARMSGSTRSGSISESGQTVRWTNRDSGNSHTVTSYHPEIFERPLRIPAGAEPWNSDYLLPNESFSMTFTIEGVYDYYCVPHEHAGMVGRIVVGTSAPVGIGGRNAGGRADAVAGGGAERVSAGRGDHCEERGSSQLTTQVVDFGLPAGKRIRRHADGSPSTTGRAWRTER